MTEYAFRYLPVAVDDVNEIVKWYRDQKAGLENEFLENLENALLKIALNPYQYQTRYKELRFKVLSRFPYRIIFKIFGNDIVVFAILHTSRNPSLIRKRLK